MRVLCVFDDYLNLGKTLPVAKANDIVYCFSLTSKSYFIEALAERFKNNGYSIKIIESARLINKSAENIRDKYLHFIAELPDRVLRGERNLRGIFAVDSQVSLWWFGLVAEKNPFKSDSFNRLAQLDAIVQTLKKEQINKAVFSCGSEKLKNAVREYCKANNIFFELLPGHNFRSFKIWLKQSQKLFYLKHSFILTYTILQMFCRTIVIKLCLCMLKRRIPQDKKPLLFFTYYPNVDKDAALRGVFRDKYYLHLQEALERGGQTIAWVVLYVRYRSISFKKSLKYAAQFIKNGSLFFFVEEFNSLAIQIAALFAIIKSSVKFLFLEKRIRNAHEFEGYNIYSILKDDWFSSFTGKAGYLGIMYYYMFKKVFIRIEAKKCLYLCEMHAWEKALISARDALGLDTRLFGYQSGTVSRMVLNFFNHPDEVSCRGNYPIPRPDKIVCNGRLPCERIKESGWHDEQFSIVEALRYNYLRRYFNPKPATNKQNIVLLVLSISPEESCSLFAMAYEALKDLKDVQVWVKPHPFLDMRRVFALSQVPEVNLPFQIKHEKAEELLSQARIAIVGQSGVTIEALAIGCEVIMVNVPEWINMSPLRFYHTDMVQTANSGNELQKIVTDIFRQEFKPQTNAQETRKIIDDFFCLNRNGDIPEDFLKLMRGANE